VKKARCRKPWIIAVYAIALLIVCGSCWIHAANADDSPSETQSLLGSLQATVVDAHPTFVDPNTGRKLWTANVARAHTSAQGLMIGEMDRVDGVFYDNGVAANSFKATKLTYDYTKKIVKGFGGVKLVSLTQKFTSLTCDSIIWYTITNKIIGQGHVIIRKGPATQYVSSFEADTKLQHFITPAPGSTSQAPGFVTIQP